MGWLLPAWAPLGFGMDLTCLLLSSLVTNLRNSMEKDILDVPSCLGEGKEEERLPAPSFLPS